MWTITYCRGASSQISLTSADSVLLANFKETNGSQLEPQVEQEEGLCEGRAPRNASLG